MYTSSSRSPFTKALLMSNCNMDQFFWAAMASRILTMASFATGEKVSVKSIPKGDLSSKLGEGVLLIRYVATETHSP